MQPEPSFTRHNAAQCLAYIGDRSVSKRKEGLDVLSRQQLYGSVFQTAQDFVENCIKPTVACFSDCADAVREKAVNTVAILLKQTTNDSIDLVYRCLLEMVFSRIEIETSEEIALLLVQLLHYLSGLPNETTVPSTFDEFCANSLLMLAKKMRSKDPQMKKCCNATLSSIISHCTQECLLINATVIVPSIVSNIVHKQLEVRKQSLLVLGDFLVASGSFHSIDQITELLEKLEQDSKAAFRITLIHFCEQLLTQHMQRAQFYGDYLFPILVSLAKLVPKRSILLNEAIETKLETQESIAAFNSLVAIGNKFKQDDKTLKDQEDTIIPFDGSRTIGVGLVTMVQNNFKKYLIRILDLLTNFIADKRSLGFSALYSLLHIAKDYSSRYAVHIIPSLMKVLKDYPEDSEQTCRCIALLSSFTPLSDLNDIILTKINSESPSHVVEAYSVCLLNSPCTDDDLEKSINLLLDSSICNVPNLMNPCVQSVISICSRSKTFKETHQIPILHIILRIGQNADVLHLFKDCFNRPLNMVLGESIPRLLEVPSKTPRFLSQLFLNSPIEFVAKEPTIICDSLVDRLRGFESRTGIYHLVSQLATKGALSFCSDDLFSSILDDMVWKQGKECISTREAATIALGSVIQSGSISVERMNADFLRILPMAINALEDQSSDLVRTAAIVSIKEIIAKDTSIESHFDSFFNSLKDRLTDPLIPVRVGSVDLLTEITTRCQNIDSIPNKLKEIVVFIDDGSEEMRNAISRFCLTVARSTHFKEIIQMLLEELKPKNYHPEATFLCNEILDKIK